MNGGPAAVTLSDQQFEMKPMPCKACAQTAHTRLHASASQSYRDPLKTVLTSPDAMYACMPRQTYEQMNYRMNPEMTGGTK